MRRKPANAAKGEVSMTSARLGHGDGADHGFDVETFREFISFDVGDGPPVFWHSVGKLYRHPEGEVIAGVEALVSNRLVELKEDYAEAICRTLLLYRDPESGEMLQDADGRHIFREYPYIVARFELKGRRLAIHTEGLSGPHGDGHYAVAHVTNEKVFAQRAADSRFFYWTLFGQMETPVGKVWFNEAYNASTPPHVMAMNRYGTLPAFAGTGDGLVQTTSSRFERYVELPESLRAYVDAYASEHRSPPRDHAEVASLGKRYLGSTPPPRGEPAPPKQISSEEIEEVVASYFSALREMDIDRLLELFDEDAMSWDPVGTPPLRVRDKSSNYFRALSTIFEKMALSEDDVFVAGGEAAVRWTGVAMLRSKTEEVSFAGVSVFVVNDEGRIQSVRSYWDKAGLMERL